MPDFNEKDTRTQLNKAAKVFAEKALSSGSAALAALASALNGLNAFQSRFYSRNRQGLVPEYTAQDNEAMLSLYNAAITAADSYISSADADEETKTAAAFINKIMLRDSNALTKYDAAEKKSFHDILDGARSVTIDLSGKETESWGGAQSQRIPMAITGRNGKLTEGVFTPVRTAGVESRFADTVAKVAAKYPDCAPVFTNLLDNFRKNISSRANYQPKNNDNDIFVILSYCEDKQIRRLTPRKTSELIAVCENLRNPRLLTTQYKDIVPAVEMFCEEAEKYFVGEMINRFELGMKDGDRVDQRNAAMSTVASLLGRRDLICGACPMTIKKDGKEIKGTFMEMAQGVDPDHPTNKAMGYRMSQDNMPGALKSIGDLQVIDYICGNLDRHAMNYFYQFEENGGKLHLKSIVGIDNDSSFGAVDNLYDKNANRLTGIHNMRGISESMAKKLEGTTSEMLRFALRTYDLPEKSLDAACQRLEHIKQAIKEGRDYYNSPEGKAKLAADNTYFKKETLRVLSDEDFNKLNIANLAGRRKDWNLYATVYEYTLNSYNIRDRAPMPKYAERTGRFTDDAVRNNGIEGNRLSAEMKAATNSRGTSDNYIAVEKALKALTEVYENAKNTPVDFDGLMAINKAASRLSRACDIYLEKKLKEKSPSQYARTRIALVQKVSEWANSKAIDPASLTEEENADLRYNNEQNIDRMAKEALMARQSHELKLNAPEESAQLI